MSKNLKITIIVASVVLTLCVAFLATVTGLTWSYFVGLVSGETYYTQEQYDQFGEENKNIAFKDKEQLEAELAEAREKVLEQNTQIFDLKNQVGQLQNEMVDLKSQKEQAVKEKEIAESKASELEQKVSENETIISENNAEIARLKSEIEKNNGQASVDQATIEALNSQVQSLETINAQLTVTNQSYINTIVELNKNIATLNQKIIDLNKQLQANSDSTSALNARIAQLEKSVQSYEAFIAQFSVEDKVVATFEFDGGVYNIQLVNKGSAAVVGDPPSTDFVIFNYWMVQDQKVENLATYYLSENTKFVANVTYKYSVKFMVDDQQIEEQIVEKNGRATNPSHAANKEGYEFEGWTLNGTDVVDVTSVDINRNTTFIAKFSKLYDVTFMYEQETKSTQKVKSGECAEDVSVDSTTYKKFNGWKVDNSIVTVTEYPIFSDTIFVADITYLYDVKFMVDGQQYGQTQIVENGKFATKPDNPTKDNYSFLGWTLNGADVIDVSSYAITQTTTFIGKFEEMVINLSDASWERIAEISEVIARENMSSQQVFATYGWKVGDEKSFTLDGLQYTAFILGFNHDEKTEGGKAGITFGMKECYESLEAYDPADRGEFTYSQTQFKTKTSQDILLKLEQELQGVIKAVNKTSFSTTGKKETTSEKIWLPSISEIFSETALKSSSSVEKSEVAEYLKEGKQYEFYRQLLGDSMGPLDEVFSKNVYPWLRSPGGLSYDNDYFEGDSTGAFYYLCSSGLDSMGAPSDSGEYSFCFCI